MPSENISMQGMPQVWPLHKPLFPENPTKTSQLQHRKSTVHQLKTGTIHACDSNEEADSSDDSFFLQLKIQCVQAHNKMIQTPACLITNLAYRLKQHENRNLYLRARLDTCTDVNIMPACVYKLVFNNPNLEKFVPSKLQIGTYTNDIVKIMGTCKLYLVHPDTKKLLETTFCVATNDGSVLLSCSSTLALDLIQSRSRLDYLPLTASLITSMQDHPKTTKQGQPSVHRLQQVATQSKHQVETTQTKKQQASKLITSKDQIMIQYPDVFEGIGKFLEPPYTLHLDPSIQPKQTPCQPVSIHLKESLKKEIDKMLKGGVLKPVSEAIPWINSFVLVESKNRLGNLNLHICLDLTKLNKAIIQEPYHFKMPDDNAHLIADACIMTVCDCHKGYWHQELDESSSFLTTFNTEFGCYRYTGMPFRTTVAGDVFQSKLDQCFGQIPHVTVIADDIMVVGKMQNHRDHNQALTTLHHTARTCNVRLNYDKLQYKQTEVEFFKETYTVDGHKPVQSKVEVLIDIPQPNCKKQVQSFIGMVNYLSKFPAYQSLWNQFSELSREKSPIQLGT